MQLQDILSVYIGDANDSSHFEVLDYLFAVGVWYFGVGVFGFWARDEFWGLYKRLHMFYFYLQVVPMVEEYLFVCKQWLAQDEGDGKIERTLKVSDKKVYNRR